MTSPFSSILSVSDFCTPPPHFLFLSFFFARVFHSFIPHFLFSLQEMKSKYGKSLEDGVSHIALSVSKCPCLLREEIILQGTCMRDLRRLALRCFVREVEYTIILWSSLHGYCGIDKVGS